MDLKEFESFKTANSVRHPWESARVLIIKRLFDSFCAKNSLKSKLVLDVGCGDGYVVSHLALNNPEYQFVGMDVNFSKEDIELLTSLYPYENIAFINESHTKLNEPVGCILLLDVLEHIEKDEEFLKNLIDSNKISDGAVFIIAVPAFNSLFSSHDQSLDHFRRYNVNQLKRLVYRRGLKVTEHGYFFMGPLIYRCFEVMKERLTGHAWNGKIGVSRWGDRDFAAKLFETILLVDASVCRFFNKLRMPLWGLTCYAICRKRV